MSEPFVWPEHALAALQQGRFEHVLGWIEQEPSRDAGLLKASVYEWWGKPLDAFEALTRAQGPTERQAAGPDVTQPVVQILAEEYVPFVRELSAIASPW